MADRPSHNSFPQFGVTRPGNKARRLMELASADFPVLQGVLVGVEHGKATPHEGVLVAVEKLGPSPWVVRSSGVDEDGPTESGAGRALSVLHVDADSLESAIHDVAASFGQGSVLIQQQLAPDRAGVAFSVDPLSGTDQIRISWVDGLADALLSGKEAGRNLVLERWDDGESFADLVALIKQLEFHFDWPVDVEWGYVADKPVIFQVRPVTGLDHAGAAAAPSGHRLTAGPLAETCRVPTPLSASLLGDIYRPSGAMGEAFLRLGYPRAADVSWLRRVNGDLYLDVDQMERALFPKGEQQLAIDPESGELRAVGGKSGGLFGAFRKLKQGMTSAWRDRSFRDGYPENLASAVKDERATLTRLKKELEDDRSRALEILDEAWESFTRRVMVLDLLPGLALGSVLREIEARFGKGGQLEVLERGAETPLGRSIRQWQASGAEWSDVIARMGHRAAVEFELSCLRWSETPPEQPSARRVQNRENSETVEGELADAARRLMAGREEARDRVAMWLAFLREVICAVGKQSGAGERVFYYYRDELEHADGRQSFLIEHRRSTRERLLAGEPPALYFGADEGSLSATGLSSGTAEGPACIRSRPGEEAVPEGAILFAPTADPAWAPELASAGAIVVERGNLLCHAAVVARELGVPAVAGVSADSLGIEDGDTVRVDGASGIVEKLN